MTRVFRLMERYSRIWNTLRNMTYLARGLQVHRGAVIVNHGKFSYGRRVTIGSDSYIDVPKGASVEFGNMVWTARNVQIQAIGLIRIGDEVSVQSGGTLIGDVQIGSFCILAPNVFISSGTHYYDLEARSLIRSQDRRVTETPELHATHSKAVVVDEDCWLGVNVVVMRGVTIGRGSVVGANSVVTKDVPPYTVIGGVPARFLKSRIAYHPPERIVFDDSLSMPYFYSGFKLSDNDMREARVIGGIKVKSHFSLALNRSGSQYVNLVIKNPTGTRRVLVYENQEVLITQQECRVKFRLKDTSAGPLLGFSVSKNPDDPSEIALASAWLS